MAQNRTEEQLLDEMVFAIAYVARYYGPGFNAEGLQYVREKLKDIKLSCDSTWRVDEPDDIKDVHQLLNKTDLNFDEIVKESKTGVESE